jgi:hypothetical protein
MNHFITVIRIWNKQEEHAQTTDLHADMDTILDGIEGTTPPSEITDVPVTTSTDGKI